MTRVGRITGVVAASVALAACASGSSSTAEQPAGAPSTATPTTATPTPAAHTFESARHGYRIEVPPGWNVTEYDGTWTDLAQFDPGAEVPGEDVVALPDLSAFLVANSMVIPDGMSPAAWEAAFDATVATAFTDDCPGTAGTGEVGGVPATVVEQPCEGSLIVGRSLTHAGRGYYFTTRAAAEDADLQAFLEDIVASIEFVDEA